MPSVPPETWIHATPAGLYCAAGDFHVDPVRPVSRAVITHGHADHARAGNGAVFATAETLAIMAHRLGPQRSAQPLAYGIPQRLGDATVTLHPAGHVLGSAQVAIEARGSRVVISGDFKRQPDPTCPPFTPVPCDVFVTEATFALPVFRHPDPAAEIARLLDALVTFPERALLVGAYALGKAQRIIRLLRDAGHDAPIFLHGALAPLCRLYEEHGVALGDLRPLPERRAALAGAIVMAPPSALGSAWARTLPDPLVSMASGWMQIRARGRRQGVELPLVLSDHADWDGLVATLAEVGAPRVWVTHGREDALVHQAGLMGLDAQALSLVGYGEEDGGEEVGNGRGAASP